MGQGGNFNIHFDKCFTPSKHVCVLQSKDNNKDLLLYFYYIIPELQNLFVKNGSTIGWLNKTNIKDFDIPIPKSQEKIKEWVDKISKPYNEKNKILYKKYISELLMEAIPINKKIIKIENDNSSEISENISNEDIIEEVKEKVKMKKVIKKVKKQDISI